MHVRVPGIFVLIRDHLDSVDDDDQKKTFLSYFIKKIFDLNYFQPHFLFSFVYWVQLVIATEYCTLYYKLTEITIPYFIFQFG